MEACHKQNVQDNVGKTADNQIVQRSARIAYRPQNAGAHIVKQVRHGTYKINPDIQNRVVDDILRRLHQRQHRPGKHDAEHHQPDTCRNGKRHGGMYRPVNLVLFLSSVKLRNDNRRAACQSCKKSDQQIDQRACGSSHRRQRLFSDKMADNHRVSRIVELLKKSPEQNRKEKDQQLLPDHTFCDLVCFLIFPFFYLCLLTHHFTCMFFFLRNSARNSVSRSISSLVPMVIRR